MTKEGLEEMINTEVDEDGSGQISFLEFLDLVTNKLKIKISKPNLIRLWGAMDTDHSGFLTTEEFMAMTFPDMALEGPLVFVWRGQHRCWPCFVA
mmetsp:Transcript_9967/g.36438  ORF Transcript_9967/g.36438 Transcript_9967/m.36438 type:complete len:95 (+) Transcript_9967:281-565(+)